MKFKFKNKKDTKKNLIALLNAVGMVFFEHHMEPNGTHHLTSIIPMQPIETVREKRCSYIGKNHTSREGIIGPGGKVNRCKPGELGAPGNASTRKARTKPAKQNRSSVRLR